MQLQGLLESGLCCSGCAVLLSSPCHSFPLLRPGIASNRLEADGWELSAEEVEALYSLDEPEEVAMRVWANIL